MIERLPVEEWTLEVENGKLIVCAEVSAGEYCYYRGFTFAPSNPAENDFSVKDLEGLKFAVKVVDPIPVWQEQHLTTADFLGDTL